MCLRVPKDLYVRWIDLMEGLQFFTNCDERYTGYTALCWGFNDKAVMKNWLPVLSIVIEFLLALPFLIGT